MKKFTLIVLVLLAFSWQTNAQSIVIGTGTVNTTSTGSDPIHGYYAAFKYQVVYTAAQLSASLTPYDEITGLGFSIFADNAGGDLLGYTIKMGHTSATNSAAHNASSTTVVKNAFTYNPTVTAAGVFDMINFDTNFVWNGVDNVLVEICTDGPNAYTSPYGQVRVTNITSGSRTYRSDTLTACDKTTGTTNGNRPNIQFNYIDGTPPACLDVTALAIDSFDATSATISWTANNAETDWDIVVQAAGTGSPAPGTSTTNNPYSATGLSGQTAYEVYVRADCGGGDYGGWTGPVNFTTLCTALTPDYTADMSTNAPDGGTCWDEAGSGEVAAGPGGLGASDWTTGSYGVGPSNRVNLYQGNTKREWLLSPAFDLSADGYELIVDVAVTNWNSATVADVMGADDQVQLLMSTDDGATWSNLTTWNAASALPPTGTEYAANLTGVTGTNVQFAIMASDGAIDNTEDYDFHVGKFVVRTIPSCPDVTDLAIDSFNASSAVVSWTENGPESDWEIAFQASGAGEPAGSGTATTNNPHIQLSLTPDTAYDVYVRAYCGVGDLSNWVGPVSFTTPPINPPNCITTYTPTPDVACGNSDTTLSWDPVSADGYYITVGTTTGGNDIIDNVDLGNVTSTTVTSQTANTTYYYTISPYNVVDTNTTCLEQTYTTFATGCYCDSVPTSNDNAGISNVRVGFTDYATGDVTYMDHSAGTPEPLNKGLSSNLEITFQTGFTYSVNVWIDFNDNYTFEPSEKVHNGLSTNVNPSTYQADFTMPISADLGVHKMRIVTADNDTLDNACYNGSFGVTLDFEIEVTEASCTPAIIDSVTVVDDCLTGTYTVEVDVSDVGSGDGLATTFLGSDVSFEELVLGINIAGPFDIGVTYNQIEIFDFLNDACSIDLGVFNSGAAPPTALAASNITGTTADLAWTSNGPETSWEVLILAAGDPAPAGTTPGTDTLGVNPYTVTGLTSQTGYDAYVRTTCGTDLDWVGPHSFTTACDIFTPDYTENFAVFLDTCWEQANGGSLTTGPLNFGSGGFGAEEFAHIGTGNGAVNINMFLGGPDIDWLLSPAFDLSADGYQLEVDVAMTDYNATTQIDGFSTGDEVRIVYSTDGLLWTDLVVYNDTNVPAAAGQTEIVDLTGITGTIVRFAFYVSEGTDDGRDIDFHIDNFKVRVPPTCFDVSGLTLDSVTDTTANISWTAAGAETNWEIAVQTAGTGAPSSANDSGTNTISNPYSATGLTAQTDYEVYVRAECVVDTDLGAWIGPLNFATACGAETAPYTEDFENAGAIPDCWNSSSSNTRVWAYATTPTFGNSYSDNTSGSGYFAFVDASTTPTTTDATLTSPLIDVSGLTNPALDFYVHHYVAAGVNSNTITAEVYDGAAWNQVYTDNDGDVDGWENILIDLSSLTITGDIQVRFIMDTASNSNYENDIAIDDVSVIEGPTCYAPSDIAVTPFATTADISWTAGSSGEILWEIVVQAPGTGEPAAADGSGTDSPANPYTATGLTSETAYEVYVRAECAIGIEFSSWVGPFLFTTTADCPPVSAITLDSVTGTTADISWTAGNSETNWEIVLQAPGAGLPVAADDTGTNTTNNPYSYTGLTAETAYEVYVRAECTLTTEFSTWAGPFSFTTPCAAITPDYVADMSTNAPDSGSCWVEAGSGEVAAGPGGLDVSDWTTGSYGYGASNRLNLYSTVDREWLLSPPFDLSADGYQLVVNVGVTNWNSSTVADAMGSDDSVQLLMSTDNGSTWTNLTTWTAADALQPSGIDYIEDLAGVTGSNVLFAIMASDGTVDDTQDYDFHVGRFEVRTPPSCPEVIAITASNITTVSADIGWTNGGSETAWEVAIQTPGTGEPAATNDSGTNSATNPYSATGLTSNTSYEVYVRAECIDGVEFGLWAGPFNFSTPCDATTDFSENFDSVTTPNLPDCWSGIVDNGASSFASVTTSTSADSSLPNGVSLYNSDSASTSNIILVSPLLSNLGDGTHRLTFNGRNSTATQDIQVGTLSDPTDGSTFTALTTVDLTTTFAGYEVSFDGYLGTDTYIGIRRLSTSTYTYVYLDDITWEAIPSCLAVTDIAVDIITTTSADISWTVADSEFAWEIVVQAAGTGEPAAADGSGTDTPINIYYATGLSSSTAYEVWVRAECTAGVDFGEWVGPFNFDTACDAFSTFPHAEGFETGVPPTCWTSFRGTNGEGTNDWTTTATANSGSGAALVTWQNSGFVQEDWLVSPEFDMTALTNPEVSFYYRDAFTAPYGSSLTIRVSTTDTAHASFTTIDTYAEPDSTTYQQTVVDLSAYAGASTVYVAFVWTNDDGDSLYIDDVLFYDNIPGTYTYSDGVWSPSVPANDLDDIIVASGNLVISSDFTCNSVTVNPGASVTVNSGTTLTATNGMMLESSSTSYSSLIRNGSIVGALEYERHVNINGSGTTGSNDLVSAPLTGQAFNVFAAANPNILSNNDETLYLFGPFNKGTGSYVTWANTETSTLDPGVGYRAGSTDNGTFTFTGTANNGIVTNDISNSGPNNAEWNLVGNPYPSYLNVQNFLLHDVGGVINLQLFDAPTAAIYGYDGSALNGWTIYNLANTTASTAMAPGQGFMVSADAANTAAYDLGFAPNMRRTGSSDDFIVGRNAELTYLVLNVSANSKSYTTDFYFNANATQGFDLGYDANIWGDTAPDFAIYSHLVQDNVGEPVALQALSQTDLNDVTIALGVNANQGEQITFSIADMTLPASVNVYLEDVVANTITLLNDSDYVFTPNTDLSGTGRFFLRTSEDALSTIDNSLDKLDIFTLKASDELVVSGQLADNTMLNLYDIQGRLVLSTKLDHTLLQNRINVSSINSGVYIVTVLNNSQEKTKKVIID